MREWSNGRMGLVDFQGDMERRVVFWTIGHR